MNIKKANNVTLTPQDIKRYNGYIWKFFIGCFAFVVLLMVASAFEVFGKLPTLVDLEHPKSNQASQIISSDKQILGKWYVENRSNVAYKNISIDVIHALVAKEDNHFYSHSGIDFWRTFTIVLYNLTGHLQGGSTLTQQLAKNRFAGEPPATNAFKRIIQKLKELVIAVRIEKHYTKEEILAMYLNTVDFGSNSFGIGSAAQTYFGTTAAKLDAAQAATLIQVLTSTTKNSPVKHPDRAQNNRNFVLKRMVDEGYLTEAQANTYKATPLVLNYHPISHAKGLAQYFRTELKEEVRRVLKERGLTNADGSDYDLDRDGLKVYTTIDSRMQQYAEDAQKEYMVNLQKQFNQDWKGSDMSKRVKNYAYLMNKGMEQSERYRELKADGRSDDEIKENFNTPDTLNLFTWHGSVDTVMKPIDSILYCQMLLRNSLMSMDPTTGYVKAWVGGINFEHFKYDQVIKGARQVGSTAKPFTYAVAVKMGYSPCFKVANSPVTIKGYGPDWTPRENPEEVARLDPIISLRTALAHSQNFVTAFLMNEVKPEPVVDLIKKMGITTRVDPYPSICLGVFDATVYDMTGAYSAFVNHGKWTQPIYLLRIEDKNGHVLYTNTANEKPALDEQTAYVVTDMLKAVISEGGTGQRLRSKYGFTNPVAGKTGTTQDNSDGWFMGMTPQLVTGVWTGCENRDFHFRQTSLGEGANSALPIFAGFMKRVYNDPALGIMRNKDFELPKKPIDVTMDCTLYNQQQKGTNSPVDKKLSF